MRPLYKPWKRTSNLPDAMLHDGQPMTRRDRRAVRDAQLVRLAGLPVIALSIVLFVFDLNVLGTIAMITGIGMMILDTGAILVLSSVVLTFLGLGRLVLRTSRRAVTAIRR